MKYEFHGMSTNNEPVDNEFTEVTENLFILNKPFNVELDNKEVELYLYIEAIYKENYDDKNNLITIGIVPSFNSLSEKHQQDILNQYDITEDREKIKEDKYWLLSDIISYGFSVTLHTELVSDNTFEHKLQSAKAVHSAVTGLIGFELDHMVNRIGNTGWDFLDEYCNDIDILQLALERYKS
jgi:hypothetical protein